MTMPSERTRAVLQTREFLQELTWPSATPGVPTAIRETARRLFRHYPGSGDIALASMALPSWFAAPETVMGNNRGEGEVVTPAPCSAHSALISSDPDVLGGVACLTGSRLPIDVVLASLDAGIDLERLRASWPFLTDEHINAARDFATPSTPPEDR